MSLICGLFRFVQFDVSFMSMPLLLCMHLGWVFVSTISLDAECPMWFPSAAVFFLFCRRRLACDQPFFLVGVSVWCIGSGGNRFRSIVYSASNVVRFDQYLLLHFLLLYLVAGNWRRLPNVC